VGTTARSRAPPGPRPHDPGGRSGGGRRGARGPVIAVPGANVRSDCAIAPPAAIGRRDRGAPGRAHA